jgi:hypothetical protein
MIVASGFGNKTAADGAGKKVVVVTNGMDLRANIHHVRLNHRPVGIGRFPVVQAVHLRAVRLLLLRHLQPTDRRPARPRHRQFMFRQLHLRRSLRQVVGAVSTVRSSIQRRLIVARRKVNVIQIKKRRSDAAEISAGAASMDTSCSWMPPNAKSTTASVTLHEKKRSDIAAINAGAASTDKSLKPPSTFVEKEMVNATRLAKKQPGVADRKFHSVGAVIIMRSGTWA